MHAQSVSVQIMLQLGALVNPTGAADHIPLNLACQYGTAAIIQQMLLYNPDILPDAEGLFPQHIVARFGGATEVLQMLRPSTLPGATATIPRQSRGYGRERSAANVLRSLGRPFGLYATPRCGKC